MSAPESSGRGHRRVPDAITRSSGQEEWWYRPPLSLHEGRAAVYSILVCTTLDETEYEGGQGCRHDDLVLDLPFVHQVPGSLVSVKRISERGWNLRSSARVDSVGAARDAKEHGAKSFASRSRSTAYCRDEASAAVDRRVLRSTPMRSDQGRLRHEPRGARDRSRVRDEGRAELAWNVSIHPEIFLLSAPRSRRRRSADAVL